MAELERPYRERGKAPVWGLTPLAPAEADTVLASRGYRRIDQSLVQRAALDERFSPDPQVRIAASPRPEWLAGFAGLSLVAPPHRENTTPLLGSLAGPVGLCFVAEGGEPLPFGMACVDAR